MTYVKHKLAAFMCSQSAPFAGHTKDSKQEQVSIAGQLHPHHALEARNMRL